MDGNGSPMYVKASGKPAFDSNGPFHGYRGTGTDVTAINFSGIGSLVISTIEEDGIALEELRIRRSRLQHCILAVTA
jgi:hypothetical protein